MHHPFRTFELSVGTTQWVESRQPVRPPRPYPISFSRCSFFSFQSCQAVHRRHGARRSWSFGSLNDHRASDERLRARRKLAETYAFDSHYVRAENARAGLCIALKRFNLNVYEGQHACGFLSAESLSPCWRGRHSLADIGLDNDGAARVTSAL